MVPAGPRRDSFSLVETRGRQDRPTLEETARPCAVDLYSRPSLALRQPNGLNGRNRHYRPRGNNSDRCQWQEEGAVVGAAL